MNIRFHSKLLLTATALALSLPVAAVAQSQLDAAQIQHMIVEMLHETPTVAGAVARDPSLLGEQSYIQRTNPKLAAFLAAHPEVVRNPDYYLFTFVHGAEKNREYALEREMWPEYLHGDSREEAINTFITNDLPPIIIIPAIFFALAWGLRSLIQSWRQSRQLKTQSDLQTRLIDKFGSAPELATYLASDAGQKLLGGFGVGELGAPMQAPLPFTSLDRILRSLQTGGMLILGSVAIFILCIGWRNQSTELVLSLFMTACVILFATGLGFILSAGIAWFTAKKFGLLPAKAPKESEPKHSLTIDRP